MNIISKSLKNNPILKETLMNPNFKNLILAIKKKIKTILQKMKFMKVKKDT